MTHSIAQNLLLIAAVFGGLSGCNKPDPRCATIAANLQQAAILAAQEKMELSEAQLASVKQQAQAQGAKVRKQCAERLSKKNLTPEADRWADCMATVTSMEDMQKCKEP